MSDVRHYDSHNAGPEWGTPPEIWRPLADALGGFDLDPASGAEPWPIALERFAINARLKNGASLDVDLGAVRHRADGLAPPVRPVFDLVVAHPPCQRWSTLTHLNGDPDSWPNHIPETRAIALDLGQDYIIENVPQAPLEEPTILSGRHFGLPGPPFRRAFETSFHVEAPPDLDDRADRAGPFADEDGGLGSWRGSKLLWRTIKQAAGDYPAEAIKNNGIPAPYIHYLAYWWLRSRPDLLDQEAAPDLSSGSRELPEARQ